MLEAFFFKIGVHYFHLHIVMRIKRSSKAAVGKKDSFPLLNPADES